MTTKTIRIMFYDMEQKKFIVDTVEIDETEKQMESESKEDDEDHSAFHAFA